MAEKEKTTFFKKKNPAKKIISPTKIPLIKKESKKNIVIEKNKIKIKEIKKECDFNIASIF